MAYLEDADLSIYFSYGIRRTQQTASAAAMTQFWECEHVLLDNSYGAELTYFPALAAVCAFFQIHLRNRDAHRTRLHDLRLQEDMSVRLFYVTVQELAVPDG